MNMKSWFVVPAKPLTTGGKKVPLDKGEFLISDLVGTALCLESGIWKKKEDLEVGLSKLLIARL